MASCFLILQLCFIYLSRHNARANDMDKACFVIDWDVKGTLNVFRLFMNSFYSTIFQVIAEDAIPMSMHIFFLVWRDSGFSLKGRISCRHEQPWWLYSLIALQQHSPYPRKFYPSENWLSSKILDFSDHTRTGISILTWAPDNDNGDLFGGYKPISANRLVDWIRRWTSLLVQSSWLLLKQVIWDLRARGMIKIWRL